eukprot:2710841-Amphidinium_carterae.1
MPRHHPLSFKGQSRVAQSSSTSRGVPHPLRPSLAALPPQPHCQTRGRLPENRQTRSTPSEYHQ